MTKKIQKICSLNCAYLYFPFHASVCLQVNLRYGVLNPLSRTGTESDTCTACAGTMILEFAALSRLSGESVFEVLLSLSLSLLFCGGYCCDFGFDVFFPLSFQTNARKALDVLWERRQKGSDLVGTVINIHNEEWVRRGKRPSERARASWLCRWGLTS